MIEVLEGKVWRPAAKPPARLLETDWIVLRGFEPGRAVRFGPVATVSDASGRVELRPCEHELLDCHIGLLRIESEEWSGEIEILPGKMTLEAYTRLRADLEATWTGLALDQGSPTAVRARGEPDALALWRQLAPAIDAIRREPLQRLGAVTAYLRLERVKKTGELTPAVLIAGRKGLSARTRVVGPALAAVEHAFVADTLRRLIVLARRQPGAGIVAAQAVPWLRESPLNATGPDSAHAGSATHSVRHDRRLRLIQRVRRALDHPAATLTEGPGELRLGVRGLNRLYEYWIFLQVLRAAERALGPPEPPGFDVLARRLAGGRLRLELPPETTVRFPGGWAVAFEPRITRNADSSWMGLEYVPHPHPDYHRGFLTPDVCVFRDGDPGRLWILDAKYRGRHALDGALTETHACYGRIRRRGAGVVEEVAIAHPHPGLTIRWAGQRAVSFFPGQDPPDLGWLPRIEAAAASGANGATTASDDRSPATVLPTAGPSRAPAGPAATPTATSAAATAQRGVAKPTVAATDGAGTANGTATPSGGAAMAFRDTESASAPSTTAGRTGDVHAIDPRADRFAPGRPENLVAESKSGSGGPAPSGKPRRAPQRVLILFDQTWLRETLGDRRVDLNLTAFRIAGGRRFDACLVAPGFPQLEGFFHALSRFGWTIERTPSPRWQQVGRVREVCQRAKDAEVFVVSGYEDFIEAAREGGRVTVTVDLGVAS